MWFYSCVCDYFSSPLGNIFLSPPRVQQTLLVPMNTTPHCSDCNFTGGGWEAPPPHVLYPLFSPTSTPLTAPVFKTLECFLCENSHSERVSIVCSHSFFEACKFPLQHWVLSDYKRLTTPKPRRCQAEPSRAKLEYTLSVTSTSQRALLRMLPQRQADKKKCQDYWINVRF